MSTYFEIIRLALLFEKLDNAKDALDQWKKVVHPNVLNPTTFHVLYLADRAHDEEFTLEFCKSLRKAGKLHRVSLEFELRTIESVSPQKAVQTIKEILQSDLPSEIERYLRLRLTFLGKRLADQSLVETDPDKLPLISQIPAQMVGPVVSALMLTSEPFRAVKAAYEATRLHPDNVYCLQAMIMAGGLGRNEIPIPSCDTAGPNTAVVFKKDDLTEEVLTYIIEVDFAPKPELYEVAEHSDFAMAVAGKKAGDKFTVGDAFGREQQFQIIRVDSKYRERIRYSFQKLPQIPGQRFMAKIHVPMNPDGDIDFSELLKQLQHYEERHDVFVRIYRELMIPIHVIAQHHDQHILSAIQLIAGSKNCLFRCCALSPDDLRESQNALDVGSTLVLESSSIATMILIEWFYGVPAYSLILSHFSKIVVSEHLMEELRDLLTKFDPQAERIGTMKTEGGLRPVLTPGEAQKRPHDIVQAVLEDLGHRATIVEGNTLKALPFEVREVFTDGFGRDGTDAILQAATPGYVLVTDDGILSRVAKGSVKISRTWTQGLAAWLNGNGLLDSESFDKISLCLIRLHYDAVFIQPSAPVGIPAKP